MITSRDYDSVVGQVRFGFVVSPKVDVLEG